MGECSTSAAGACLGPMELPSQKRIVIAGSHPRRPSTTGLMAAATVGDSRVSVLSRTARFLRESPWRAHALVMRAWVVASPGPVDGGPLRLVDRPYPEPGPGQLRVAVSVCGVCRTDLHLAE